MKNTLSDLLAVKITDIDLLAVKITHIDLLVVKFTLISGWLSMSLIHNLLLKMRLRLFIFHG